MQGKIRKSGKDISFPEASRLFIMSRSVKVETTRRKRLRIDCDVNFI